MEYNFREIEKRWQSQWVKDKTYHTTEDPAKEKFYVLNMFPYPSGAGLHVGHPLGYIASDIYARYKRLKDFNVLNQHWLLVRLGPRDSHLRPEVLPLDSVGVREDVRLVLLQLVPEGAAD